ncbi:SGNH/GDSL hydrolase family protein [Nocardioides sp. AX2bis]|uniref:SGNH/GDSL hydrolase family protein n=1 Tax=Nocardioides sp. AX2bis TaxID=2653157 RepID=UPI0012EF51A5|nr:SGNH/GDSL hydrolase family protein [Nocardioides sp. AX2bis]VXB28814.1 conserved hypothetical protein [Nocardioides sp. AX2bis]
MLGLRGGRTSGGGSPLLAVVAVVMAVVVIAFSGWLVVSYPPPADLPAEALDPSGASSPDQSPDRSPSATGQDQPTAGNESDGGESDDDGDDAIQVAVLGDGYTTGSPLGGEGEKSWTAVLGKRADTEVTPYAVTGSGYVAGPPGTTYVDRAEELVADWTGAGAGGPEDAVVVMGSRSDAATDPAAVEAAARRTLAVLTDGLPDVTVVVVGPLWPALSPPTTGGPEVRAAVQAAAEDAGVAYADPLAEPAWLPEDNPAAVAEDAVLPTNLGHGVIATRVRALLTTEGVLG